MALHDLSVFNSIFNSALFAQKQNKQVVLDVLINSFIKQGETEKRVTVLVEM